MPITADQRWRILAAVKAITVNDFGKNFEPIYERAHQSIGDFPHRADLEIRNGLSHFFRAITAKVYQESALDIIRARRHIRFAIYLCLVQMIERQLLRSLAVIETLNERNVDTKKMLRRRQKITNRLKQVRPISLEPRSKKSDLLRDIAGVTLTNIQLELALLEVNELCVDLQKERRGLSS